jgi:hypothetical protein
MVLSTQREPFLKRKEWFCPHRENRSLTEKNGSAHTERTVP